MADYDPDNIFAKILRGELPSHTVHEDDDTIVIMDVMPQAPGHALVIPKSPARNLLDAEPMALGAAIVVAQRGRWRLDHAVQRSGGRTIGLPPAFPRHPAP